MKKVIYPNRNQLSMMRMIMAALFLAIFASGFSVNPSFASQASFTAATSPTLSINDVSITEGNSGIVFVVFTVTLSEASSQTVTVDYATQDGTATVAGSDYLSANGTITFHPGDTEKTITVYIGLDTVDEVNEVFYVNLSNPVNASIADGQGLCTIIDDDGPTISINNSSVTEGNAGSVNLVFSVALSYSSVQTVRVDYQTSDVTAKAGEDYIANSGTLTFSPGDTAKTITIQVLGDALDEDNETFNVTLSNPVDGFIGNGVGVGTITDDDALPVFSIAPINVTVDEEAGLTINFTITLSPVSGRQTSVKYKTANVSASSGQDYIGIASTQLIFAAGETSKQVTVTILDDNIDEENEVFHVRLETPINSVIAAAPNNWGVVTIIDDEDEPEISILNPAPKVEGNTGTSNLAFTVQLTRPSSRSVVINYETRYGTKDVDATPGVDFIEKTGSVTVSKNASTATISIAIYGDILDEVDEVFTVTITSVTYAILVDDSAIGIIDDDDGPGISIAPTTVIEGNSAYTNAVFTVTLTAPSPQEVRVNYRTNNGTASAPSDYTAIPTSPVSTLVFAPGMTENYITVAVVGDIADEVDETFSVILSGAVDGVINGTTAIGTIDDDDGPIITINNVSVVEGDEDTTNAIFNIDLSYKSKQVVTVQYVVIDLTATAGEDYITASGELTFPVNITRQTITVQIYGDTEDEIDETFQILLSDAVDAFIAEDEQQGIGTILDDDGFGLRISDVTVTEGDDGSTLAIFTVSMESPSAQEVSVQFATQDGTAAVADNDYLFTSGALVIATGAVTETITVTILGDLEDEIDETFSVVLSDSVNATIEQDTGVGTIDDDDGPEIHVLGRQITEGDALPINLTFVISLTAASPQTVTVQYSTNDATAVAGTDYTADFGVISLPPGVITQTVSIEVLGDLIDEDDEYFTLDLSDPVDATIGVGSAAGGIVDNDGPPSISIADLTALETNSGLTPVIITLTLSLPSEKTISLQYMTQDESAIALEDYVPVVAANLSISPGETSKTITVYFIGDTIDEVDETFLILLSNPTNVSVLDDTGVITIDDDDGPNISISNAQVTEGHSGAINITFTVTLSAPSPQSVTVEFATGDDSATAGEDYEAAFGFVTFLAGETEKTITITVYGDTLIEGHETFLVTLSNAVDGIIVNDVGVATIFDDDYHMIYLPLLIKP